MNPLQSQPPLTLWKGDAVVITIEVDDEIYRTIRAAACGRALNHGLRDLLGLPAADTDPGIESQSAGDLAELIKAGMLKPGEHLLATAPILNPHPIATVTDTGHLRDTGGVLYPGPAAFIRDLRGGTFAPYAWQCLTTADGTRLATLIQRLAAIETPHLLPAGPGALAPLIEAGLLAPGDQLRLPMRRRLGNGRGTPVAVGLATVTDDGCFLLPDGARYLNPSAATAAYRGNPTGGWTTWTAPDGRRLAALRDLADRHRRQR